MRRSVLALIAVPALFAASACSAPATTTTTPAAASSSAPTSSAPASSAASTKAASPSSQTASTVTVAPSGQPTVTATKTTAPSQPGSSQAASATPVNVGDYLSNGASGSGAYFSSPSGNFICGITDLVQGCQARVVVKDGNCGDNPSHKAKMIDFYGGPARNGCTTQGIFGGGNDGKNKVLEYGTSITHKGFTCTSQESGMKCVSPQGSWFTLSTDGVQTG